MRRDARPTALGAALAVAMSAWATAGHAQENVAIAEQLFRDARRLIEEGKVDQACTKFADSQRLAPAVGTELNLALCREKQGLTATAWSLFAEVDATAQRMGDVDRGTIARQHEAALASQLKKIVIDVPAPVPGMAIALDGIPLPASVIGSEVPLDPGNHVLVVTVPGKKTWKRDPLTIGPGDTVTHVAVDFTDEGATGASPSSSPPTTATPAAPVTTTASPPASATSAPAAPEPEPPRDETRHGHLSTVRLAGGIALGAAGLGGIAASIAYGLTALSRKNDETNYPAGAQDRLTVYDQAKAAQSWSIAFGVLGGAALGAGIVLLLPWGMHGEHVAVHAAPFVGAGEGGVTLGGSF